VDRKVAAYVRVSSDEQRENETIEIQEDFLSEYCRLYEHPLIHPLGEDNPYRDNGVSGTVPFHERPGGARSLEDGFPILDMTWNFNPPEEDPIEEQEDSVSNTSSTCRAAARVKGMTIAEPEARVLAPGRVV
jgi:Resolvase, N terminal domain